MAQPLDLVTLLGVVSLGLVHGAEPGHGWPVAATYALDRSRKWLWGVVASVVIGVGHLVSSLAVVAAFFLAKSYFDVTEIPWLNEIAGVLLVALGVHEYRTGHSHSHGSEHEHGDHGHSHDHDGLDEAADRGLLGLASAAFVLGFAHEEEFEIIGICAGTESCLPLMAAYALAVLLSLVCLTLLLVAGYHRYEDRVERVAPHFSTVSAVVLVGMGLLFIAGVL